MLEEVFQDVRGHMQKSIESLRRDFASIRTGRATTAMLDGIRIDYYGTATPLNQLANLSVPEPRLLTVKPYEQHLVPEIEKAIRSDASLGLNPSNDGTLIHIPIPELTEERRIEITKIARHRAEESKVAVRHARRDGIDFLQQAQMESEVTEDELHHGQDEIQKITDAFVEQVDQVLKSKEEEIMEV